ncbi:hypothetical protein SK128_025275, partial [Halocaridina rubra]
MPIENSWPLSPVCPRILIATTPPDAVDALRNRRRRIQRYLGPGASSTSSLWGKHGGQPFGSSPS